MTSVPKPAAAPAAMRRARRNLRALRVNQDERMKAIAERALDSSDLAPTTPTDR